MSSLEFQKKTENFVCKMCGANVVGDGYTNHCPECLWSKHVDINPGDRAGKCGGMMEPISVNKKDGQYNILHKCMKCGFERLNKTSKNDNFDMLIQISANQTKK